MSDRNHVLLQVACCPAADPAIHAGQEHPCSTVVCAQGKSHRGDFQLPEPWRGDIENAPLLFVSSNPSFNPGGDAPKGSDTREHILHYYGDLGFPASFPRRRSRDGASGSVVPFWAAIRKRAAELYGVKPRRLIPGKDFALTEVVHCKSQSERGAREAASFCVRRHFEGIAKISGAGVVVILGTVASDALGLSQLDMPCEVDWYGRRRYLVTLPHPNARQDRTFRTCYHDMQLVQIREALRVSLAGR
jgi:hypothetical protein